MKKIMLSPDNHGRYHCGKCGAYLPTTLFTIPDLPPERKKWECESCGQVHWFKDGVKA